jgi:hypothetical protein
LRLFILPFEGDIVSSLLPEPLSFQRDDDDYDDDVL